MRPLRERALTISVAVRGSVLGGSVSRAAQRGGRRFGCNVTRGSARAAAWTAPSIVAFSGSPPDGTRAPVARAVAVESPVAIEMNGLGYAVMMATPADLADFAYGFARAERLIDTPRTIVEVDRARQRRRPDPAPHAGAGADRAGGRAGAPPRLRIVVRAVRDRESGAGAAPAAARVHGRRPTAATRDLRRAGRLRDHQPLNRATGAVHAAALCAADGTIRLAREDVGRHNAFDKLIGAMLRGGLGWDGGFALLSARCSYELVEKAVLADCPLLVTVSAPTSLALDRAAAAGLRLGRRWRPGPMRHWKRWRRGAT